MISSDSPKNTKEEEKQPQQNFELQTSPKENVVVPLLKPPKKSPLVQHQMSPSALGANSSTPTAAGAAASGGNNTAQKKSKAGKKKPQEMTTATNGALNAATDKYKNIPGVSEWFQAKKSELEKQNGVGGPATSSTNQAPNSAQAKKNAALLGLPLSSHIWRPPRIDQQRFQVDDLPLKQDGLQSFIIPHSLSIAQGELFNPEVQFKDIGSVRKPPQALCKKRRSRSFDQPIATSKSSILSYSKSSESSSSGDEEIQGLALIRRKMEVGAKDIKVEENQSPLEIKVAAATGNKRCLKCQEKTVYDPINIQTIQQQDKLKEYLELVEFLMGETLSSCNGLWLKGSLTSYSERALHLLHQYAYNFDLACFHLLYPSVMAVPERRTELLHSLTETELHAIVTDAVIDLKGCKTQEAEEAVGGLRTQLFQGGFTLEDLQYHSQVLKKLRVEMPAEVEREVGRSREFSKVIKKKCGGVAGVIGGGVQQIQQISMDKKMKFEELLEMHSEARLQYYVITPEMITLNDYVQKAQNWIEKADLISKQVTQLKSLQTLLQDARSIPVNFDVKYESLKKRSQEGENIVQKIYNIFTKVTKTRTQLGQGDSQQNNSNSDKELQYRLILKEADAILITNPEIVKLREHIEQIDLWKSRVSLFLEDTLQSQKEHKETFLHLIKETALFKVELELTEDLQRRLEFVEWHDRVDSLYRTVVSGGWLDLGKLEVVVQEGTTKGFAGVQMEEVQKVVVLYRAAEVLQKDIQDTLQSLESGKEVKELSKLIEINEQVQAMRVRIEEVKELAKVIEEAQGYVAITDEYLSNWSILTDGSDKFQDVEEMTKYIQDLIKFRDQIRNLCITCPSFTKLNQQIRPLVVWIENTKQLIKVYQKSLDLQVPFAQLNLMEGKDYDDEILEDIPDKDYPLIHYLTGVAIKDLKILLRTKDYLLLNQLNEKVAQWTAKFEQITSEGGGENPETLEKLLAEHLPVPPEKHQMLSKHLRRVRWLKRLQELRTSEKVKLKSIETLAKEGSQLMVTDKKMLEDIALVNEQVQKCREWSNEQNKSDLVSVSEIKRLLNLAKDSLQFALDDYVDLKNFYSDTCQWRDTTKKLLTMGQSIPEFSCEFLKQHIEQGKNQLGIDDKETTILSSILELSTQWKSLAKKLLQTREIAKLELPNQFNNEKDGEPKFFFMVQRREVLEVQSSSLSQESEVKTAFTLQEVITPFDLPPLKPLKHLKQQYSSMGLDQDQEMMIQINDNKRYCICRRGDDGLQFMVECDSCKEWFHGHCVGINSEEEAGLKEQQNYICIGCARAFYQFDYTTNEQKKKGSGEESQQLTINPVTLKVFMKTTKQRMSFEFLKRLIEEGLHIPLYLSELYIIRSMHFRTSKIKLRANYLLSYPLYKFKAADQDQSDNEDYMDNPYESDSSSDMIINTKISNVPKGGGEQEQERAACWGKDRIGCELLQIYLETESFPFEIDSELTDDMIKMIRVRRWYWESHGFISQVLKNLALSNNMKAQLKKNLKRMISSFEQSSQGCNPHLQVYMEYQLQCLKLALESLTANLQLTLPEIPQPIKQIEQESSQEISSSDVEMIEQ